MSIISLFGKDFNSKEIVKLDFDTEGFRYSLDTDKNNLIKKDKLSKLLIRLNYNEDNLNKISLISKKIQMVVDSDETSAEIFKEGLKIEDKQLIVDAEKFLSKGFTEIRYMKKSNCMFENEALYLLSEFRSEETEFIQFKLDFKK